MAYPFLQVNDLPATYDYGPEDGRRLSCWFVTVNSNVAYRNMEQCRYVVDRLTSAADSIFAAVDDTTPGEYLDEVLQWNELPTVPQGTEIEITRKPEVGAQQGRIHLHLEVKVIHTGNLTMNYRRVRELFKELVGDGELIKNPYVHIRLCSQAESAIYYMEKGLGDHNL